MSWRRIAERRIETAIERGEFRDLPGEGRPLPLEDESKQDPAWRLAFLLLRNAGLAPAWVELDQEIERRLAAARRELRAGSAGCEGRGQTARRRFAARIRTINGLIEERNLRTPVWWLRRGRLDPAIEIQRLEYLRKGDRPDPL